MVHPDSMSPTSLAICEKLWEELWELKASLDRYHHDTLGLARSVWLPPLSVDPTHHQVVIDG